MAVGTELTSRERSVLQEQRQASSAACVRLGPTGLDQVGGPSTLPYVGDLALTVERAGATIDLDCSLCQAGTFGTGSGKRRLGRS